MFIALEPSAKQLHTAASSVGHDFMKANNLIEQFIAHCCKSIRMILFLISSMLGKLFATAQTNFYSSSLVVVVVLI